MRSTSSPDRLNYNLFVNAGRSTVWGDGAAGTSTVFLKNVKKNRPVFTTIYGRIPPGQDVSVGSYSDSLTVTITP
jgi:spore coat protein U-like protein